MLTGYLFHVNILENNIKPDNTISRMRGFSNRHNIQLKITKLPSVFVPKRKRLTECNASLTPYAIYRRVVKAISAKKYFGVKTILLKTYIRTMV